jgi:hypothetical protein
LSGEAPVDSAVLAECKRLCIRPKLSKITASNGYRKGHQYPLVMRRRRRWKRARRRAKCPPPQHSDKVGQLCVLANRQERVVLETTKDCGGIDAISGIHSGAACLGSARAWRERLLEFTRKLGKLAVNGGFRSN